MLTQKQNMMNFASVKNLGKTENFDLDVQDVVFGLTLCLVDGNFQMTIFVTGKIKINTHVLSTGRVPS